MMRAKVPSASFPEQTPYAAADAAFAAAQAYLSSREAQQMSESDLERELHRLGQDLMHKLMQGHREQRDSLAEAADRVEETDEVDVIERLQGRVPESTPGDDDLCDSAACAPDARIGGAQTPLDLATAAVYDVDVTAW